MTQQAAAGVDRDVEDFISTFQRIRSEIGRFIVGQEAIVENVLIAVICGGHVLLEGVPGVGKTALVTTLSRTLELSFRRIQFTPDLLPADIVGSDFLVERGAERELEFQPGPVFCNVLLADEINRATPKTQSALLETMQERTATVTGKTHLLPSPFFVLATQNPIEQDGTYPLPEAQLDRFFFKLDVALPDHGQYVEILRRTGGSTSPIVRAVATGDEILAMNRVFRKVPIEESIENYLVAVVRGTHPEDRNASAEVAKYVRHGASPRGAQAILAAARVRALLDGRYHVARDDIDAAALPALRHRLILSFEGESAGVQRDELIRSAIAAVRTRSA